jgi:transposase
VGDIFMSLIHTVELCDSSPFDYLVALLRHHAHVAEEPARWLPWSYLQALDELRTSTAP